MQPLELTREATDERSWTTLQEEREGWGAGPWITEADRHQWVDAASRYRCLMLRNHNGIWCGYVGIPPRHPLYGVGFSEHVAPLESWAKRLSEVPLRETSMTVPRMLAALMGKEVPPTVNVTIGVHGGVNFSGQSNHPSLDLRENQRQLVVQDQELRDALQEGLPLAEAAAGMEKLAGLGWYIRLARRMDPLTDEEWMEAAASRSICWMPSEPLDQVWWFGFDCGHYRDYSPLYPKDFQELLKLTVDDYRTEAYVRGEVEHLAGQLHQVALEARGGGE